VTSVRVTESGVTNLDARADAASAGTAGALADDGDDQHAGAAAGMREAQAPHARASRGGAALQLQRSATADEQANRGRLHDRQTDAITTSRREDEGRASHHVSGNTPRYQAGAQVVGEAHTSTRSSASELPQVATGTRMRQGWGGGGASSLMGGGWRDAGAGLQQEAGAHTASEDQASNSQGLEGDGGGVGEGALRSRSLVSVSTDMDAMSQKASPTTPSQKSADPWLFDVRGDVVGEGDEFDQFECGFEQQEDALRSPCPEMFDLDGRDGIGAMSGRRNADAGGAVMSPYSR